MDVYGIALSGMNAAQTLLDVTANNIANAQTPGYQAQGVDLVTLSGGGVQVAGIPSSNAPFQGGTEDEEGSNVDLTTQAVNLSQAKFLYDANAAVVNAQSQMIGSLLDIFDNENQSANQNQN
jgi:flagellar basal-body rod protein FlgC